MQILPNRFFASYGWWPVLIIRRILWYEDQFKWLPINTIEWKFSSLCETKDWRSTLEESRSKLKSNWNRFESSPSVRNVCLLIIAPWQSFHKMPLSIIEHYQCTLKSKVSRSFIYTPELQIIVDLSSLQEASTVKYTSLPTQIKLSSRMGTILVLLVI